MTDQTLAAPTIRAAPFCHVLKAGSVESWGMGSNVHLSAPVRASNARTSPLAGARLVLSATAEPVMTRSPTIAGGDVTS